MARNIVPFGTAEDCAWLLGVIIAKIGPLKLTEQDMMDYNTSQLRPFMNVRSDNSAEIFLLGEDEVDAGIEREFFQ